MLLLGSVWVHHSTAGFFSLGEVFCIANKRTYWSVDVALLSLNSPRGWSTTWWVCASKLCICFVNNIIFCERE
jgi:hypothetical protein